MSFQQIFAGGFIAFLIAVVLSSCSMTKFVPDGNYLLDKVEVKTNEKSLTEKELSRVVRQEPNFKVFGLYRLYLAIYGLSGRDSSKWLNRNIRLMGEKPVIYDPYLTSRSEKELQRYMQAKGYVNANVTSKLESKKKKKAKIIYTVTANEPYVVRNVSYNFSIDSAIDSIMQEQGMKNSRLTPGMLFDTGVLDKERERIAQFLRRQGYYYFSKEYLSYTADSSLRSHQVDIVLNLRPFIRAASNGGFEEATYEKYSIRRINVYLLKKLQAIAPVSTVFDTIEYKPTLHIYSEKKRLLIRPKVIENELNIFPNQPYNEFLVERTYSNFNSLGIVRSCNIQFNDLKDSLNQLDCSVILTPMKSHSFSFDVEGTNSLGDLGVVTNTGFQHRNIFRGSELLSLKFSYAQEAYSGGFSNFILGKQIIDIGGEASINFPRFMFPFVAKTFKQRVKAQTEFKTSYNYQIRPGIFERTTASVGTRYIWNMHRFYRYTFDILDLNYVKIYTSPSFDSLYSDSKYSVLRYSYSDHFILNMGFSLMYDDQLNAQALNKTYYRLLVESAGNLLYAVSYLSQSPKNSNGFYEMWKIPYSQYVKGEIDYSFNRYIDKKNRIVYHAGVGIVFPYGNAQIVPFEKRFFGGGANGVRGWGVRTLGPGSFSSGDKRDFVRQSGDIKLNMNIEYRSKLFWKMELAAFADAGNIWTIKNYESQPGGAFRFDEFYKQIALAYGMGLRFDFTYFLLRFDVGAKAYDPSNRSKPWRISQLKWSSDDFALHFAIGYPF